MCNLDTAVSAWKKIWRDWGCRHGFIRCCILLGVDTPLVQRFEEVDYEMALRQFFVALRELGTSEIPPATALVQFWPPLGSFFLLFNGLSGAGHATFGFESVLKGEFLFVGWYNVDLYAFSGTVHATCSLPPSP